MSSAVADPVAPVAERPELGAIREFMLIDGEPVRQGAGATKPVHETARRRARFDKRRTAGRA
jgi:phenylacetaldehyde dehydrogenase